jgi:SAM-dependent methyltransferase
MELPTSLMVELPADRRAHLEWLPDLTDLPTNGLAVDLGCGRGDDLRLLAERYQSSDARFIGVDRSATAVGLEALQDARVTFRSAALDGALPFADATLDLVYSHNLVECLADHGRFAAEVARVLRPGGRAVIAHWDWDTQVFDGSSKATVRRLVASFADWQQAWMTHADGWMGRRLSGIFARTKQLEGRVHARVLTNTAFAEPWFGHTNALAMAGLVKRGLASAADYEDFLQDQATLHAESRYFYGITGFAYVAYRNAK